MRRKIYLATTLLILTWSVMPILGLQSSSLKISSYGIVRNQANVHETIVVDFEAPEHFEFGSTAPIWNAAATGGSVEAGYCLFEPSTDIVHGGRQSAKLALLQPDINERRRLHFEHRWAPDNRHFWTVAWFYLPTDFVGVDAGWHEILRCATTYMHVKGTPWTFPTYNWWKMSLHLTPYNDRFKIFAAIGQGVVDNDGDGVNDYPGGTFKDCRIVYSVDTIGKGEWNKLVTYVYRDKEHGVFRFWLNDVLQWDEKEIDTLGISFERMQYAYENPKIFSTAKVTSGISLYTGIGGAPKTVYFDDVILSNNAELAYSTAATDSKIGLTSLLNNLTTIKYTLPQRTLTATLITNSENHTITLRGVEDEEATTPLSYIFPWLASLRLFYSNERGKNRRRLEALGYLE